MLSLRKKYLISYLNENSSLNNITLKMIWKYKLIITVVSCGQKGLKITCGDTINKTFSSSSDNGTYYIIPGETLILSIANRDIFKSNTNVTYKPNNSKGTTIENSVSKSASLEKTMPEDVVTITVQNA